MLTLHNDNQFKVEYNPILHKAAFRRNDIGAVIPESISIAEYAYTDANSIFICASGNDTTGAGTQANPYKTVLKGASMCTAIKTCVIILDSSLYIENLSLLDNELFNSLFAATGQTPKITRRTLDYTASDSNSIFVSKTGNDTTGTGTQANPFFTIRKAAASCDSSHQNVMILDSEIYSEYSIDQVTNFRGLRSVINHSPIIQSKSKLSGELMTNSAFGYDAEYDSSGNMCFFYTLPDTGYNGLYMRKHSPDGTLLSTTKLEGVGIQAKGIKTTKLNNGNIVVCYTFSNSGSDEGRFRIISDSGTLLYSGTFAEECDELYECITLTDGKWVVVWSTDIGSPDNNEDGWFAIYTDAGAVSVAATRYCSTTTGIRLIHKASAAPFKTSSNWVIAYSREGAGGVWYITAQTYNTSGVLQNTVSIENGTIFDIIETDVAVFSNDRVIVFYSNHYNNNLKYAVYSSALSSVKSPTTLTSAYVNFFADTFDNDLCSVISTNHEGTPSQSVYTINSSGTIVESNVSVFDGYNVYPCLKMKNGNFLTYYLSGTQYYFQEVYSCCSYLLKAGYPLTINGITIKSNRDDIYSLIVSNSLSTILDAKFCNIGDAVDLSTHSNSINCYNATSISVQNCRLKKAGSGIKAVCNTLTIKNNLFYWNDGGYAIEITGAGAGIDIQHNTIFDNYAGIRLISNNGSEVVKNNIFYENSIYSINADTEITLSYSINIGTVRNVNTGSSVVTSNPLFKNEGGYSEAAIDLQLKMKLLGNYADSPAYILSDTTPDRDAGAWDIIYIGTQIDWTTCYLQKTPEGFNRYIKAVGDQVIIKANGENDTSVDGWTEYIEVEYKGGISSNELDSILTILTCGKNQVKVYPDPFTYPNDYNLYKIHYQDISTSATRHYALSRKGAQEVKLLFSRSFEY